MTRAEREAFLADTRVGILAVEQPGRGPLAVPGLASNVGLSGRLIYHRSRENRAAR